MLYPAIDSLMNNIDSKYTLISVAAKRARDIQDGSDIKIERAVSRKYVGVALEEIKEGLVEFEREL